MYRDKLTGQYPISKQELVSSNTNISLPAAWTDEVLEILGVDYVKPVARPEITSVQRLVEGQPEQREDGQWYQTWAVSDMSAEEVAALVASEKDAACARLNAKRDAIQYGAFTDSHGHPYDVDSKGREKMTGLEAKIANGLTLPEGFTWTGADNAERPHTNATFLALTTEILLWTSTVHGVCVAAKAAIRDEAVTTLEQVAAIEAGVVWP